MEFLRENIGDCINNIVNFLDWSSYENLLFTQKTNLKLLDKKEYYKKNAISWDKIDLAWKNNSEYWNLINTYHNWYINYVDKIYKLNYIWWFELSYITTNLKGKYKFVLNMSRGTLRQIHYKILINDTIVQEKQYINLYDFPEDALIKLKTDYITSNKSDIVRVIFYETNFIKNNMFLYYLEIV
jgi:hypothetical protein